MSGEWVTLGDGLSVSPQGFGAMGLSHTYGHADRDEAIATLQHAIDAGASFVDTADVYGQGENERLVGEVVRARREQVRLASKFGLLTTPDADGLRVNGDPARVRSAVEASLERLGVERLDLYYYHRVDPRVAIERTVEAMASLVEEGLVSHLGLSEVTGAELERAATVHPIAAVQSEWSVWSRDIETHVVPAARRLGTGIVAYAPLGRGFLAAPLTRVEEGDNRRNFPRFDDERLAANQIIAERVRRVAERVGATPAQTALAWLAARATALGIAVVPIPGTRRRERVDENLGARVLRLPAWALAELEPLAELAQGDRARDAQSISQGRERNAARVTTV